MPLWNLADMYLRGRRNVKIREEQAAAEGAIQEDAERPSYTPEEEQEVRALWSEPVEDKEIDGKTVTSHINRYIDTRTPEQLKSFARLLLKHGFDLPKQRANELAEVVVQNRDRLKGSFYSLEITRRIEERINQQKKGPDRNITAVVLSNPRKYSTELFEHFFRRPPGGKPFLTPEEWEHGKMPPRRRGPTA